MKVLKFGGTSVGTAERVKKVSTIVAEAARENGKIVVVSSAFGGVTDRLVGASEKAVARDKSYLDEFEAIKKLHFDALGVLVPDDESRREKAAADLESKFVELDEILRGVYLLKERTLKTLDYVMSFGERLSCRLIAEAVQAAGLDAEYLDARPIVKTDAAHGAARVNFEKTDANIRRTIGDSDKTFIVTGFIGSTDDDETTTIGRGGSDYTASILGAALDATEIEIWTDVNGVLTADPRKVKNAFSLERITYEEAMELSHFGAKVVNPPTMMPALRKKIPIRIRNTFDPSFPGTVIAERGEIRDRSIKGVASLDRVALLSVKGVGLMRPAGVASRIFGALAARGVDATLITQSSSEHRVSFAVLPDKCRDAKDALAEEFRLEIKAGEIRELEVESDLSMIAVIGEETRDKPGVAGRVFQALGKNGVNVRAIAQGSSEMNLTAIIPAAQQTKSLNALHDDLFLSRQKTINLFMIGVGLVGGALLKMIQDRRDYLDKELGVRVKVVGLANSRTMLFDEEGVALDSWKSALEAATDPTDPNAFVERVKSLNLSHSIFLDCTGVESVVSLYAPLLESSVSVVTPSKLANAGPYDRYVALRKAAQRGNAEFRYGANVGAALPIVNSLRDLIANGDRVVKIEGVLSGTLSYIFNTFSGDKKFSDIVKDARAKGFTEPDPRDDLNGLDVARKLLILVREAGVRMELEDVEVESLVPEDAKDAATVEDFMMKLVKSDFLFQERKHKALMKGCSLMYVARFEDGKARVGLEEINKDHPFYNLSGNDNVVSFTTKNFYEKPLALRGSGAGAELTAAGVFTDVLRAAN